MPQTIGELQLKVLLEIVEADKAAKQFSVTLKNVNEIGKKTRTSIVDLSDKASKMGFVMNSVKEAGNVLNTSLRTIFDTIRVSNEAYQQYLSSQRQLDAASKLTGASLDQLTSISQATKSEFALSSNQSNLFTIELTKLGQKAGDVSKVSESIKSLLDVGAGQGLDTEQTLYAIKQAILGIDEGTDKLFQKNPSVIYDEYAKSIGTTAGKLTDQQKAQALLNAVLESGGKLTGKYSEYLNTAAGKQQVMNNQLNDARIKLGLQLQPVLTNLLDYLNRLLTAYNSLDKGTQTFIVTSGVLLITLGKLAPLLSSIATTFPGVGSAAASAGGTIARVFGSGGPVVIAIGLTLFWVKELIDKIQEADEQARQLEQYQQRKKEGTFVPLYDPNSPGQQAIQKFKEILAKNPNAKVTVDGKEIELAEHIKNLEAADLEAHQYGITWNEMTGQVTTSVDKQKHSIKELGDQLNSLNEQLSNMKSDDPTLKNVKSQRDAVKSEYDKLNKEINPPDESKGSRPKKLAENLDIVSQKQKDLTEKQKEYNFLKAKGFENAASVINDEIKTLQKEIDFLKSNSLDIYKDLSNLTPAVVKASEGREGIKPEEEDVILKFRIALQDAARERKEMEDSYNLLVNQLSQAYNLTSAIANKMTSGGKDFWYWIQAALATALQIAKLTQQGKSKDGIGFGDVLGLIGTVLPFFLNTGGEVPGAGSTDSVPAMLTPGEFVINKSAAGRLGVGFLQMLNQGGAAQMIPTTFNYAQKYMTPVIINVSGELTSHLLYKIASRGNTILKIRNTDSTF